MELLVQIKKDRMQAFKGKQTTKYRLLTTLVGESDTILKGKQAAKYKTTALIKKFLKGLTEMETARGSLTDVEVAEKEILESYLPKQLTEEQTREILASYDLSGPIGKTMGFLKGLYGDTMDLKLAGKIIRESQE